MLLQRFYDEKLAQASYLVGCQATGEAVVIDPARSPEPYLEVAAREGLRIAAVTETHIHADFLSGARELAYRTGAILYVSDEGPPEWKYGYRQGDTRLVRDGDSIELGKVNLRVVATPGHTPEHIAFLLTDTPASDQPLGLFTGDFLFVGDVGRPDLLERAAGHEGTMEKGARVLFQSLQKLKSLPDHLLIWPGHGAGSACGKGLGAVPHSTLGYERLANWALKVDDEEAFVRAVLSGQPDPPRYFAQMKRLNRAGPALLSETPEPVQLGAARLAQLLAEGAFILDARPAAVASQKFLPGTLNIPLNKAFPTWSGWLVPYARDLYVITDDLDQVRRDLASIGLDRVTGWFRPEAVAGMPGLTRIPSITPEDASLRKQQGGLTIVDVRTRSEWDRGHIPGARHIPLGQLPERMGELKGQLAVHCQSGARSAIAASLMSSAGVEVWDLGGFPSWQAAGLPVEEGLALTT